MTSADLPHDDPFGRPVAASGPTVNLRIFAGIVTVGGATLTALPAPEIVLCPLRAITGVPCPFCGMTTGTLALGRGDLGASVAANPASIMLVLAMALAFGPAPVRDVCLAPLRSAGARASAWLPWLALPPLWVWQLARFDLI